jgi:hypothetical protein
MSFFEITMLLCFGAAWPVSIYKSWVARTTAGKSVIFLLIVLLGYLAGIAHKLLYSPDPVIWFYVLNASLVLVDILVYYRNALIMKRLGPASACIVSAPEER